MSTNGQVTYHTIDSRGETGVNYVFSMKKEDFKPLKSDPKKLNRLHKEAFFALFAEKMSHHWFWDGSNWLSYTRQQMAENVHKVAEESVREQIKKEDEEKAK